MSVCHRSKVTGQCVSVSQVKGHGSISVSVCHRSKVVGQSVCQDRTLIPTGYRLHQPTNVTKHNEHMLNKYPPRRPLTELCIPSGSWCHILKGSSLLLNTVPIHPPSNNHRDWPRISPPPAASVPRVSLVRSWSSWPACGPARRSSDTSRGPWPCRPCHPLQSVEAARSADCRDARRCVRGGVRGGVEKKHGPWERR